ncbi:MULTISPECIES: molybdenum cofactor biosynthesis protein MoaE [Trueperella]|uniref:Molybdopterin synthase catalytic subunit n=1 Tax=Trueperella abortisuis TaxID=445930 RepID=A0ABT9PM04_9ACTO|nr:MULTISPECIES: molybdenum cofactor biosynthesis protein MoaE [Trueperella]MCI7306495.1 molybdenum cofactor biosynthesis protein MoaE [Trueperella sp.]MDP9833444.1 molybdopterin synthase catalytic subunit [Trueperella abortisuis]MDY5403463.1 molybdenum cofactor biosynthesis protein MoaE [Trueperella sp.]
MDRIGLTGVQDTPIDSAAVADSIRNVAAGALVVFEGIVRNHDAGRGVTGIEYSCHPSAAEVVAGVAAEVADRHPECRVAVVHRVGKLAIGDLAMVAAVASPHRGASFAAIADVVDTIKAKLPVWKRQLFTDGTDEWVGSA